MKEIKKQELIDHGIEHSQYFQGCGVSFTDFDSVATGIGNDFAEAVEDCLNQIADMGFDSDKLEKEIKEDYFQELLEKSECYDEDENCEYNSELWYHVSVRFSE